MSKNQEYGFVYVWYDRKNKMYYVGCHWGLETDKYVCSSERMRSAYRRRPKDFKRRVVARVYTNRQDLLAEEHKWLSQIKDEELGKKFYNLNKHHFGHWSSTPEAKTIAKKSGEARRGKSLGPCSEETKQKISAAKKGKPLSEEHKSALREAKLGTKLSEEHRSKIASSHKSKKEGYIHHTKLPGWVPKPKKVGFCVKCGSPTPSRRAKFCIDHFTTKPKSAIL